MRYLKIASAKNPDNDFIELNDFNGFLCTFFQTLGMSRKHEFLAIENRQFSVDNKPEFKKYSLTIEILTKYSEYEAKYSELITFLDRNKKVGFRLYYRPYDDMELRYCFCDVENLEKTTKLQPVLLTLIQNSLWFGTENKQSSASVEQEGNVFAFVEDMTDYYAISFYEDEDISNYYCVKLYNGGLSTAEVVNHSYNEIPLIIRIYGSCVRPKISLFKKGENTPIKQLQILESIADGYYVEINANIKDNGVRLIGENTEIDYSEVLNNELGSPYFYIDNGEYYITAEDVNENVCNCDVIWQEEYN